MKSSPGEEPQVLLVDPDGRLETHLSDALTSAGFGSLTVTSAAECIALVKESAVDGVISRHGLPEMDGSTLLRSIRVSKPYLPVLLLSPTNESVQGRGPSTVSAVFDETTPEAIVSELSGLMDEEVEGHQRYKHLIEMSPAPINIFDRDGRSVWCNDAVVEMFGLSDREEFLGRSILEMIHPDDRERAQEEILSVIKEKESVGPTRMRLRRDDGSVRYIRVSTAIGEYLGTDIGQAIAIDETSRIERERQLKVLDNWLRHNIRNKMAIIRGLAEDIQADRVDDVAESARKIQEHTDTLVQQADHERRIIQLLETDRKQTHVTVAVDDIVAKVINDAREDYPAANITVPTMESFHADAIAELDIAVRELVENAIIHNDTEVPEVMVEVEDATPENCVIRITDNGPGIPEIEQSYLQLDKEIDELQHGSGLGLVLVYWVVRLSEGTITATDNDPRGSVVTINLHKG
ncbi:hypothetical protein DEQ92_18825 [Haloferax sp. Atlit-6N]|uniref:PAS domain S-box protein n=1 Tax=Haloferax sp. Atlit-6N TaxID=2077205 RepID=UPI000E284E3D|nr:PAS domain S-box protein [Haloferax sp. Atlit-6N]REA00865.1 hypothetical protein DEQ92_18825 [Haloferax sp. Atlit-6N]